MASLVKDIVTRAMPDEPRGMRSGWIGAAQDYLTLTGFVRSTFRHTISAAASSSRMMSKE